MSKLYAWIGDLVSSRHVDNRPQLAANLEHALQAVADKWPHVWLAPPVTVRGLDEVSAVLTDPSAAFDAAVYLNEHLWPQVFRIALAEGTIDVIGTGHDASSMDGPAFHNASDTIQRCERQGLLFAGHLPSFSAETVHLMESLGRLHSILWRERSQSQAQRSRMYREFGTQEAVARQLSISQQAVSASLLASHEAELEDAETAIRGILAIYPAPDHQP